MLVAKRKAVAENCFVAIILLMIAFAICMLSPIDCFSPNGVDYTDQSVFHYMARIMNEGMLPYRDSFDHKGILIYFFYLLGLKISYHQGVWIVQVLFMILSVFGAYKLSRLVAGKVQSIVALIIVFSLMTNYYQGGGYTEDFALPMQIWSLYIFFDYFLNRKISRIRLIVLGALLAMVCFLRINMIPVWVVFCILVFVKLIRQKEYKQLLNYALWFLLGFSIVTIPVCVYLISRGIWTYFIDDYWVFNKLYSSDKKTANLLAKLKVAMHFVSNPIVYLAIVLSFINVLRSSDKKERDLNIAYLFYILVNFLLICLSGRMCDHYGMVLMPMLIYPYAVCMSMIHKKELKELAGVTVFTLYVLIALVIPGWVKIAKTVVNDLAQYYNDAWKSSDYQEMIEYIDTVTSVEDLITVYGNQVSIYNMSDRFSASRYTYQSRADIKPEIMDEYYCDLDENDVKLIVLVEIEPDYRMNGFMNEHNFAKTQTFGTYAIYEIQQKSRADV